MVPFFKEGIHAGTVTVTKVGKFKKKLLTTVTLLIEPPGFRENVMSWERNH